MGEVFVHTLKSSVLECYNRLRPSLANLTENARLSVLNDSRISPETLARTLQDCKNKFHCGEMKSDLQRVIDNVLGMLPGGGCRLFVCHSKTNLTTSLELMCVAVCAYRYQGQIVCDYCYSTYFYSNLFNWFGMDNGNIFDLIFGFGILRFGLLGLASSIMRHAIPEPELKDKVEAMFIDALVRRGYASLGGNKLYLKAGEYIIEKTKIYSITNVFFQ